MRVCSSVNGVKSTAHEYVDQVGKRPAYYFAWLSRYICKRNLCNVLLLFSNLSNTNPIRLIGKSVLDCMA